MTSKSISGRLIKSFSIAILIPSLTTALVAVTMIYFQVLGQTQARVTSDLEAAREIFQNQLEQLKNLMRIHATRRVIHGALAKGDRTGLGEVMDQVLLVEKLDTLTLVDATGRVFYRTRNPTLVGDDLTWDPLVQLVLRDRAPVASTQIVPREELLKEAAALAEQALMEITPTPKALPTQRTRETSGMMLRSAAPVFGADGHFHGALVGGVLLNRNNQIVDKVQTTVFKDMVYHGHEVGTATIFQHDVRISTNVKNSDGTRAITTRVSAEVARSVLDRGETWRGRAFVVNDWYLSAYAPIADVANRTIGMLYVGTLERPYTDAMHRNLLLLFGITLLGVLLVFAVSITVAQRISRPVRAIAAASQAVAQGDYSHKVVTSSQDEIGQLAADFNRMTEELARAHGELREWGANLERKVEQRTSELKTMQSQMLQRDKLASIGELVAGIAHEINNPNTFIRGNIAIVAEALETILPLMDQLAAQQPDLKVARLPYPQFRQHIQLLVSDIGKGADKIMNIVSDLKKFARHDEGLLTEEVSINGAIDSCLRLVHNQVKRSAKVHLELGDKLPPFKGNVQKIEQVLVNIIINAAQAIEDKKESGNIWIRTLLDDKQQVLVRVRDDGNGMNEETRKRIFDPFFTTKRPQRGTGLGLSIAYAIVSEHNGSIEVTSEPGVGSEFSIAFPLQPRAASSGAAKPDAAAVPSSGSAA